MVNWWPEVFNCILCLTIIRKVLIESDIQVLSSSSLIVTEITFENKIPRFWQYILLELVAEYDLISVRNTLHNICKIHLGMLSIMSNTEECHEYVGKVVYKTSEFVRKPWCTEISLCNHDILRCTDHPLVHSGCSPVYSEHPLVYTDILSVLTISPLVYSWYH